VALGKIFEEAGDRDKAIEHYRRATQFDPDNSEARAALDRLQPPSAPAAANDQQAPAGQEGAAPGPPYALPGEHSGAAEPLPAPQEMLPRPAGEGQEPQAAPANQPAEEDAAPGGVEQPDTVSPVP